MKCGFYSFRLTVKAFFLTDLLNAYPEGFFFVDLSVRHEPSAAGLRRADRPTWSGKKREF